MSYVRRDDQHEYRRLTEFRERLSGEVGLQTGEEFPIFRRRDQGRRQPDRSPQLHPRPEAKRRLRVCER
jgi:hypothetical protein